MVLALLRSVRPHSLSVLTARRWMPAALAALVLLALPAAADAFTLQVTGPPTAPRMVFDQRMSVAAVCLPVTNPAGGRSVLYGQRFTDGPVSATTPAIVLVHGIASSTEDWDFSPSWSVARALASAGYVVFSYDRLGYAKSSYFSQPAGGHTLTTAAHRAMLHDVVGDVRSGGYEMASGGDCAAAGGPGTTTSQKVVVIGHSAGGWVVSGYPGTYHDVSAMVEADISGSAGGSAASPLGGSSSGGSFTPDPAHPDYFVFFQTVQDCHEFNTDPAGAIAYVVQIACTPPYLDSPFGEIEDLGAKFAQDDAAIAMIGPTIPVLLTSGEQDTTDPPSSAQADYAYYKAHCGCDVTQLLLPDTGHLFMVHRSLPTWVDHVVDWLAAHGLGAGTGATPGAGGGSGTSGPSGGGRPACARPTGRLSGLSLGPVQLGWTRAHTRARLPRFNVTHNNLDNFCLTGRWGIRVGYPSAGLLRGLGRRQRASVAGRAILALTANRQYALDGVRPGTRLAPVARRLHARRPLRIGTNDWYVLAGRRSDGVLKVRGGVIQEVGIVNRGLSRGRRAQHRLLSSFRAA
jgi:pimeloyl-ACP methyl ester carboxylesterase